MVKRSKARKGRLFGMRPNISLTSEVFRNKLISINNLIFWLILCKVLWLLDLTNAPVEEKSNYVFRLTFEQKISYLVRERQKVNEITNLFISGKEFTLLFYFLRYKGVLLRRKNNVMHTREQYTLLSHIHTDGFQDPFPPPSHIHPVFKMIIATWGVSLKIQDQNWAWRYLIRSFSGLWKPAQVTVRLEWGCLKGLSLRVATLPPIKWTQ